MSNLPSVRPGKPRQAARLAGAFLVAVIALQLSQVFLFPPGSDLSPWASVTHGLNPNTIADVTPQTWALGLLAVVCGIGALRRTNRLIAGAIVIWIALAGLGLIALFTSDSASTYIDGVGKIVLPILVYLYLAPRVSDLRDLTAPLILAINLFTVGQSVLSKLVTGSFGANNYYYELAEEYFGFYHHPFAFSGVLGVCSIVALFQISNGRAVLLNSALLAANLVLLYQTQVRTYIVAVGVALTVAVLMILVRNGKTTWLVAGSPFVVLLLVWLTQQGVANDRVTADASSGRIDRWVSNLQVAWSDPSPLRVIFGGGPQRIFEINEELIGTHINSLNVFIDTFVSFGVLGLILFVLAWWLLIRDAMRHGDPALVLCLAAFMLIAASLSNAFEFPFVAITFVIALTVRHNLKGPTNDASARTSPSAVSRGI